MPSRGGHLYSQAFWLGLLDLLCLATAIASGVLLRQSLGAVFGLPAMTESEDSFGQYVRAHMGGWVFFCASVVGANSLVGSYSVRVTVSRFDLVVMWLFTLFVGLLTLAATSFAMFEMLLGRGIILLAVLVYGVLSLLTKGFFYGVILRSRLFVCRTVIVGTGRRAAEIRNMLEKKYVRPRHVVCGWIDIDRKSVV